jgi:hypothetical protein
MIPEPWPRLIHNTSQTMTVMKAWTKFQVMTDISRLHPIGLLFPTNSLSQFTGPQRGHDDLGHRED